MDRIRFPRMRIQPMDDTMVPCNSRRASVPRASCIATTLLATMAVLISGASHAGTPASGSAVAGMAPAGSIPHAAVTQKTAITIRNFAFEPATLTVSAGSKVVWTNRDDEPHLVASAGGQFPASPALDTDDSYGAVFEKPGTYAYFCSIHPHMVGTIIVK
jgi:plastocyanin